MKIKVIGRVKQTAFRINGCILATRTFDGAELEAVAEDGRLARVELTDAEVIEIMRSRLPVDPNARAKFLQETFA